ncbi:MAG: DUF5916 domain-containing protein, partial [Vicinamibacterales bacterium]
MKGILPGVVALALLVDGGVSAWAQPVAPGSAGASVIPAGSSETVSRGEGGTVVRAIRLQEPLRVDGTLDEAIYEEIPPISDFIQQEPQEGQPATERTEAWIFFDAENVYISARCWDSHPERAIANEMRRDSGNIIQNENFAVTFDTLNDGRNGVLFQLSKLGGLLDVAITDERDRNPDWNAVWDARTADFDQGWTAEVVIPFKSLRYAAGQEQTWGVQMRRIVRWKNEWSYLTAVPAFMGPRAMLAVSLGATLEGLEAPPASKNLEIKPYMIFGTRSDWTVTPTVKNDLEGDLGFDLKYGVTKSLTADVTYNTDFAQVENDEQQVNLTRFNLFFPEKRDFFLEGQGIFAFGGAGNTTGRGGPVSAPVMFFSRRIGLNEGLPVPITGGGRLTGKAGKYAIGVVNIQSGEDETAGARSTNFSVLRLKRDLFQRSNVGAIYTRRSVLTVGDGVGETFGVDALASFSTSLNINMYYARTRAPGRSGRDASYMARFDYDTDRYGLQLDHTVVEENFNPEVGFLRRSNFDRRYVTARFSPRPAAGNMTAIRKFFYVASYDHFVHGSGRLDTRDV